MASQFGQYLGKFYPEAESMLGETRVFFEELEQARGWDDSRLTELLDKWRVFVLQNDQLLRMHAHLSLKTPICDDTLPRLQNLGRMAGIVSSATRRTGMRPPIKTE